MTDTTDTERQREWVAELNDTFGDEAFTSHEACEVLAIEWIEFIDAFVALNENSGLVQRAENRGNQSTYRVVECPNTDKAGTLGLHRRRARADAGAGQPTGGGR